MKEPKIVFERHAIALNKPSFIQRLRASPIFFLRVPKLYDFRKMAETLKFDLTKEMPVLYLSIFLFFLSSGLFNTSFVPALQDKQVSNGLIFLVTGVATTVQTVSFMFSGNYTEKISPRRAVVRGLLLRSVFFGFIGLAVVLFFDLAFYVAVLVLYPLASGLAYAIYYTGSNTMVFNGLGYRGQGATLGVYSAFIGIALLIGSFLSGFISAGFGFTVTFVIAAVCLIVSAWLIKSLGKNL